MSVTPQEQFTARYGAEVKKGYQGNSMLADKLREDSIVGDKKWFPRIAEQEARERIPGAEVEDSGGSEGGIWVSVKDYDVAKYVATEDQDKLDYNQAKEYGLIHAMAIGRRKDQIIFDCFERDVHAKQQIPVAGSGETIYDQILAAQALMGSRDVPSTDRCLLITHGTIRQLLKEERFTNIEQATLKSINDGMITKAPILGFELIPIGERKEGGLPKASVQGSPGNQTATRTLFAFHKDAVARATSRKLTSSVDWIPQRKSHLVQSAFAAGCGIVDKAGLVSIKNVEPYVPYQQLVNQ